MGEASVQQSPCRVHLLTPDLLAICRGGDQQLESGQRRREGECLHVSVLHLKD